jgi:hypothetical protein
MSDHTIFGAGTPTLAASGDATPVNLAVGVYQLSGSPWEIRGVRFYVPAGTPGLPSTGYGVYVYGGTVTGGKGVPVSPALAAVFTSDPVLAGQWNELRFATRDPDAVRLLLLPGRLLPRRPVRRRHHEVHRRQRPGQRRVAALRRREHGDQPRQRPLQVRPGRRHAVRLGQRDVVRHRRHRRRHQRRQPRPQRGRDGRRDDHRRPDRPARLASTLRRPRPTRSGLSPPTPSTRPSRARPAPRSSNARSSGNASSGGRSSTRPTRGHCSPTTPRP